MWYSHDFAVNYVEINEKNEKISRTVNSLSSYQFKVYSMPFIDYNNHSIIWNLSLIAIGILIYSPLRKFIQVRSMRLIKN